MAQQRQPLDQLGDRAKLRKQRDRKQQARARPPVRRSKVSAPATGRPARRARLRPCRRASSARAGRSSRPRAPAPRTGRASKQHACSRRRSSARRRAARSPLIVRPGRRSSRLKTLVASTSTALPSSQRPVDSDKVESAYSASPAVPRAFIAPVDTCPRRRAWACSRQPRGAPASVCPYASSSRPSRATPST